MTTHAFDGKKLQQLIDNHNKIVSMQEEEQYIEKKGEIDTNSFNHCLPHDSPTVFDISPKRAWQLKQKIEPFFYDIKYNGDKERKNIYVVDTAEVMKYILEISNSVPELLYLTFELGVLTSPLYQE